MNQIWRAWQTAAAFLECHFCSLPALLNISLKGKTCAYLHGISLTRVTSALRAGSDTNVQLTALILKFSLQVKPAIEPLDLIIHSSSLSPLCLCRALMRTAPLGYPT